MNRVVKPVQVVRLKQTLENLQINVPPRENFIWVAEFSSMIVGSVVMLTGLVSSLRIGRLELSARGRDGGPGREFTEVNLVADSLARSGIGTTLSLDNRDLDEKLSESPDRISVSIFHT